MKYLTVFITIFILVSFGCAQKAVQMSPTDQKQAEEIQAGKYPSTEEDTRIKEGGIVEEELAGRDKTKGTRGLSDLDTIEKSLLLDILFEFDSYTIKTEYYPKLNEIVTSLKSQPNMSIAIEGNCDERGTIEYNLALGQKRAEAVKNYLVKLGVDGARIKVISFGKELPLDPGHTEEAWSKNRRAHIKIDQKG
jgi:peptidoglycan-associated lipoprotein